MLFRAPPYCHVIVHVMFHITYFCSNYQIPCNIASHSCSALSCCHVLMCSITCRRVSAMVGSNKRDCPQKKLVCVCVEWTVGCIK